VEAAAAALRLAAAGGFCCAQCGLLTAITHPKQSVPKLRLDPDTVRSCSAPCPTGPAPASTFPLARASDPLVFARVALPLRHGKLPATAVLPPNVLPSNFGLPVACAQKNLLLDHLHEQHCLSATRIERGPEQTSHLTKDAFWLPSQSSTEPIPSKFSRGATEAINVPARKVHSAWWMYLSMSLTPEACEAVPACSSGRSSRQTESTRSKPGLDAGCLPVS
jgi:hypothetical protein